MRALLGVPCGVSAGDRGGGVSGRDDSSAEAHTSRGSQPVGSSLAWRGRDNLTAFCVAADGQGQRIVSMIEGVLHTRCACNKAKAQKIASRLTAST